MTLSPDGSVVSRREIDPERAWAEAARDFAVGSDVARLRHRFNLSQQAFARRLRIPLATIQIPMAPFVSVLHQRIHGSID